MKKTSEINIRDPFVPLSDGPVTPADWECLDGTLYVAADGTPYLVFCHEWLQVKDGEMCAMPLTPDLTAARTAACCKKFAQPNAARCSAAAFFGVWASQSRRTERRILTWNPYKFASLPRRTRRPCLRSTRRMWSVPPSALN